MQTFFECTDLPTPLVQIRKNICFPEGPLSANRRPWLHGPDGPPAGLVYNPNCICEVQ